MTGLKKLKAKSRADYKKIGSVYCSILDETVYFTAEGFNHLLYEAHNRPRSASEQFMKLKCLPFAVLVVKTATLVKDTRRVPIKQKGKWKKTIRYGIVHEVKPGTKMRVVVERVGDGQHKFLSIMPDDKASKHKLGRKSKKQTRSRNTKKRHRR